MLKPELLHCQRELLHRRRAARLCGRNRWNAQDTKRTWRCAIAGCLQQWHGKQVANAWFT